MADKEALAYLKSGPDEWNDWQTISMFPQTDLSHCDLRGADLTGYLLGSVRFEGTNLNHASFVNANLVDTIFTDARLEGADFTGAIMERTVFARTSLATVRGLTSITHLGPSSVGLDTLFRSGGLPGSFLRGCGVPEEFIAYTSSLVGTPIEYYTCFLSHSHQDEAFARKLHKDLQDRRIRVWYAPEDLKIGDRLRPRIDEAIHLHEKLVLILSKHSVESQWVEDEVERALARERKENCDVLFPIRVDDAIFDTTSAWARGILNSRHIGDFRADYDKALDRLVRDLKKSQPPIVMRQR